jgi:transposase
MLTDDVEHVIGADTHKDTHALAFCDRAGGVREELVVAADQAGYRHALEAARVRAPGGRLWAIEGAGSYGRGLTDHLLAEGERVVEVERPKRTRRKGGAKSDPLDAVRAAREAIAARHLAEPRMGEEREALRILLATREQAVHAATAATLQVASFIVSAPERLRAELRGKTTRRQLRHCAGLRPHHGQGVAYRATGLALRAAARRALALRDEARMLETEIRQIVGRVAPALLGELGVGPITGAQLLVSFSHRSRFRSEAAFASLAGAAPIPASSGQTVRHRLNRGGDRQLNRALDVVVRVRLLRCPETRAYVARRRAEGKTTRESARCLKRFVARRLFRLLSTILTTPNAPDLSAPKAPTALARGPRAGVGASTRSTHPTEAATDVRSAADILARLLAGIAPEDQPGLT